MGRIRDFSVAVALAFLVMGCSRKAADNSNLTLSFSSTSGNSAQATTEVLDTVIVNVSGPGISAPKLFECRRSGCGSPLEINLSVPKGAARLIQVLLVYGGQTQVFKYGDITKDLTGATETVDITVTKIGSASVEGTVAGRYLDGSTDGGPTGVLEARFLPPTGQRPMTVVRSMMLAGWFNLFVLDGTNFTYLLNGKPLFEKVNVYSPQFAGNSNSVRVHVPAHARFFTDQNGQAVSEPQGPEKLVIGYFGPAVTTQKACYDNRSSVSIPEVYSPGTSSLLIYAGSGTSSLQVHPELGGTSYTVGGNEPPCTDTSSEFLDHLVFSQDNLRNGKDSVAGFRGPFRLLASGNWVDSSTSGNVIGLSWNLLPGTTGASGIRGVTAFIRPQSMSDDNDDSLHGDNGITCSKMSELGFQRFGSNFETTSTLTAGSMSLTGVPPNQQIVLCPYFAGPVYADIGAEVNGNGGDGGGGGGPLSYNLVLTHSGTGSDDTSGHFFATNDETQQTSSCKQYVMSLKDSHGLDVAVSGTGPMFVLVNGLPSGVGIYSDPTCGSATSIDIGVGSSAASIYLNSPAAAIQSNIDFIGYGTLSATGHSSLDFVAASPGASYLRATLAMDPPTMVVGQCYPIAMELLKTMQSPGYLNAPSAPVTMTATVGGQFYTAADCTGAALANNYSIAAYKSRDKVYFKPSATSALATISLSASGSSLAAVTSQAFQVDDPASSQFVALLQSGLQATTFDSGNIWSPAGCSQLSIEALTTNFGRLQGANRPGAQNLTVTVSSGNFYSDSYCTTGMSSSVSFFYPNERSVYYKSVNNPASFTIASQSRSVYFMPAQIILQSTTVGLNPMGGGAGVVVGFRDSNNRPYKFPIAGNVRLNMKEASDMSIQGTPSTCMVGQTSTDISVAVNTDHAIAYACETGASSLGSLEAKFFNTSSNSLGFYHNPTVPGSVSAMRLIGMSYSNVAVNKCESILAYPVDPNGYYIYGSAGTGAMALISGMGVTSADTNLYYDGSCTSVQVAGGGSAMSTTNYSAFAPAELFFRSIVPNLTPTLNYASSGTSSLPLFVIP